MARASKRDPALDKKIVQWDDLPKEGQRVAEANMRAAGESMPQRVQDGIEKTKSSKDKKSSQTRASLQSIAPDIRPEPITLQRAANSRQRLYQDALARQAQRGDPDNVVPAGADWYFEHHARIANSAEKVGYPKDWAQGASAVMSPQNSPQNERAAVAALMEAHANSKVHVTPEVATHLAGKGIDVSEHVGKIVHADDLPTGSLAQLSTADFRPQVPTDADLHEVARGGTKQNIVKAEQVLSGDVTPEDAVVNSKGVISASKVASYSHVTRASGPGSAVHVEFIGRMHQDALARAAGGASGRPTGPTYRGSNAEHEGKRYADHDEGMDLYGFRDQHVPNDHLLSPKSHSVEDTWENAVTFNQPKTSVGEGPNKTSVFKAGGSGAQYPPGGLKTGRDADGAQTGSAHPDPRMEDGMVLHAFNNKATQKAAAQQGRASGTSIPPVGMQAVTWTEARVQAAKSPEEIHDDYRTEVDVFHSMGRTVPQHIREQPTPEPSKFEEKHGDHVRGQQALWGDDIPTGPRRKAVRDDAPDMSDADKEADMRKWTAIGDATRKSRRRRQSVQE